MKTVVMLAIALLGLTCARGAVPPPQPPPDPQECFDNFLNDIETCLERFSSAPPADDKASTAALGACLEGANMVLHACLSTKLLDPAEPPAGVDGPILLNGAHPIFATRDAGELPTGHVFRRHVERGTAGPRTLVLINGGRTPDAGGRLFRVRGRLLVNGVAVVEEDTLNEAVNVLEVPIVLGEGENTIELLLTKEEPGVPFGFLTAVLRRD